MRELRGRKVCFVAGTLGQGGAERQLYYMLRALKDHGALPRVLSLTAGEYWEERIKALGVPVTWVGRTHSRLQRLRAIIRELEREPAEILQSQHFYTNIYVAAAARYLGIYEIGALRSDAINEVGANSGPLGWLSLRAPRAIAANSRQAIENAVRLGMPRSRLNFLPNVVDTCQFTPVRHRSSDVVRVLTIGRMVPQKRLDRFLRTIAAVQKIIPGQICGVLVGDGPGRANLEKDAREFGLFPGIIEFHGLKSDVADFYHGSDVFLLTSDWEGTPNVVLEAMASGLPVVSTLVGGVSALIRHGETGYAVDPNDETALADAVADLVRDREKRIALGDRAREFVEQHHARAALAKELRKLYDGVLPPSTQVHDNKAATTPLGVERLLIITSVIHYRDGGRLWAYGPYALEIESWAKIFPQLVLAAPCRTGTPPGDCLPIPENVGIQAQPETGGTTILEKLAQLLILPYSIWRLVASISRADAVHVRCPGNLGLLGALITPLLRRHRVAKFAGQWSAYDGEPWTVRLQRQILRSRWWKAPVMVYTDKADEPEHVVPFFTSGFTAPQVARGHAVRIARTGSRLRHVLYAGRLSVAKNVSTLLDAVATVRRSGMPLTCTIVGEGPERWSLEHQAESLNIRDSVTFAGGMKPKDVLDCYEAADILVLASETEGWPKTLTEAMTFGVICIGSDRGLIPGMLAEKRGFVVSPGDVVGLAEALRIASQMPPEDVVEMRSRAAAWAGRFTAEQFRESLEGLLEKHWRVAPQRHFRTTAYKSTGAPHRVGVMHLTDTLEIGGAERMAVSLANSLTSSRFAPHLCMTRRTGPLADMVAADVGQLVLNRRKTLDVRALWRLVRYIRRHDIQILHAHGTAVFVAAGASLFRPYPKVVWHIHYGRHAAELSSGWQYRTIRRRIQRSIAVSEALAGWASKIIGMPPSSVAYIPNFSSPSRKVSPLVDLPGKTGARIVCVANFLPEKDHLTLIGAMERIAVTSKDAHLLLIGGGTHSQWGRAVTERISESGLKGRVSLLGQRRDVAAILDVADIGVLSSEVEGLPLALIEYGEAGLPVVVTSVGQCADVVDHGRAGLTVQPRNVNELADALERLLGSSADRNRLGEALRRRVREKFNARTCIESVYSTYDQVMSANGSVLDHVRGNGSDL